MGGPKLVARVVFDHNQFEWVFLVWYLVYGLLTLLFLFYFNRLLAGLASFLIRLYTWHYYRVYVRIHALQISPLAGRIFFKGIQYYGRNETILVQDGYVTWRYWLLRVQDLGSGLGSGPNGNGDSSSSSGNGSGRDSSRDGGELGGPIKSERLPCRVAVKVRGVQWFVYNRSPAYDMIVRSMTRSEESEKDVGSTERSYEKGMKDINLSSGQASRNSTSQAEEKYDPSSSDNDSVDGVGRRTSTRESGRSDLPPAPALPSFLNILPVGVECGKAAVVMGNQCTRSILVAKIDNATGQFTAQPAGAADLYKQVINFDFAHPTIQFKHNADYKNSLYQEGQKLCSENSQGPLPRTSWYGKLYNQHGARRASEFLKELLPHHKGSVDDLKRSRTKARGKDELIRGDLGAYGQSKWLGLTRYLDDEDDMIEQERWKSIEYAQLSQIVDSPGISMSFFWDIPGTVSQPTSTNKASEDLDGIIGDSPPEWGIELKIRGGAVNYGPWADRQRVDFQKVFFPPVHKDAQPVDSLPHGATRLNTELKIIVIIEEQITMRVPFREESKDWQWKGRASPSVGEDVKRKRRYHPKVWNTAHANQGPESRPFGWLDARIMPDSTVSATLGMVAKAKGYHNRIDVDLKGIEMSSSVNHGMFWRSQAQTITCDLSNPLEWNMLRQWHIDITDTGLELFILRDHMFLLTDLINDWSAGPPPDFHTFVPFEYTLNLRFLNIRLYINANDSNIIDNPLDLNENAFVILASPELVARLSIPMRHFRVSRNKVEFDAKARDGSLDLSTPSWNTQHTFLDSGEIAGLKELRLGGSYNYFTTTSPSLTDTLIMNVFGSALKLRLYGFLIRYFMNIKDNYFGEDMHFRTSEEYQRRLQDQQSASDANHEHHKRPSNDLDTILKIKAEKICTLLPAQLYSAGKGVKVEMFCGSADLRITNYYMDLAVTSSPISLSESLKSKSLASLGEDGSDTQLSVEGVEILGHRLFGLPPDEPTYVCNWDFDVGSVRGQCSTSYLEILGLAIGCFATSLDDNENALDLIAKAAIHDVTFLRAVIQSVQIALCVEDAVCVISAQTIDVAFNDMADSLFSQRLRALITDLKLAITDIHDSITNAGRQSSAANTYAYLKTSITLDKVSRVLDFQENLRLQQSHLALQDCRTKRVPWLLQSQDNTRSPHTVPAFTKTRLPAMQYPHMPSPVSAYHSRLGTEPNGPVTQRIRKIDSSQSSSLLSGEGAPHSDSVSLSQDDGAAESSTIELQLTLAKEQSSGYTPLGFPPSSKRHLSYSRPKSSPEEASSDRLGLAFSSPYKQPQFPLLATLPDTTRVPDLSESLSTDNIFLDEETVDDFQSRVPSQDAEQTSIMVEFPAGLQSFCTPKALMLATHVIDEMQADDVLSLLDSLHVNVVQAVLDQDEKRKRGSTKSEVRIFVPFSAIRFSNILDVSASVSSEEQYDLTVSNMSLVIRSLTKTSKQHSIDSSQKTIIHLFMHEIKVSARESLDREHVDQAVVSLFVVEPMLWFVIGPRASMDLQLGKLDLIGASSRVEYVSSLLQQTAILSNNIATRFSSINRKHSLRLQLFVLLLATEGQSAPDPPFLSGASVLRSSTSHLRTSHSWRMLSRLRHIFINLPDQSKEEVQTQCVRDWTACPEDAAKRVASFFEQWRMWDMGNSASDLLMQTVYGKKHSNSASLSSSLQLNASLEARRLRVIIDPGMNQNEVTLEKCLVGISTTQHDQKRSDLANTPPLLSISVHCSKQIMRLNWSLCELMEDIAMTMQSSSGGLHDSRSPVKTASTHGFSGVHVVMSSELGILNIETINAKVVTVCRGLQFSVMRPVSKATHSRGSISLVISAARVRTEAYEGSDLLGVYTLHQSHLFGCRRLVREGEADKPWKYVGSGQQIRLQVLATPLELTEVIDRVIRDEVTHLTSWAQKLPAPTPKVSLKPETHTSNELPKAHVALFLDSYNIDVAILPSLVYTLAGSGIRCSVQSATVDSSRVTIDIDLKEHSHSFGSNAKEQSSTISTLKIPPINCYLKMNLQPSQKVVNGYFLIDQINFHASSLHALFDAINRPAIVELGKAFRHEVDLLQQHVDAIFPVDTNKATEASRSASVFLFDANALIRGVTIHAFTPDSHSLGQATELRMDLGRITMKGTNNDQVDGPEMPIAEFEAKMKSIQLNLLRTGGLDSRSCGNLAATLNFIGTSKPNEAGKLVRSFEICTNNFKVNLFTETTSAAVAILGHLQDTLRTIELPTEVRDIQKLGRARLRREGLLPSAFHTRRKDDDQAQASEFSAMYSLVMRNIQIAWKVGNTIPISPTREAEDLILSIRTIDLATRRDNAARLLVERLQLQIAPPSQAGGLRSSTSALMPELVFNVAYKSTEKDRKLAFQVIGKTLDLKLTSESILPANDLRRSIAVAADHVRKASEHWTTTKPATSSEEARFLGNKKLASLLIHADFAGAVVQIQGKRVADPASIATNVLEARRRPQHGRYNQFIPNQSSNSSATLRAPGIALKVEYKNTGSDEQSLSAEMKVSASSNTLFPAVVPLVMEMSSSVKEIVEDPQSPAESHPRKESKIQSKLLEDEKLRSGDPSALLGNCKLNLGLRICKQDFSLSCQPIARVAASARFDDIYITVNTAHSLRHGKFFSITGAFTGLEASVQHVYSRESTGNVKIDSIVVSLMNSKHVTAVSGISAIAKLSPLKAQVNVKQLQDFLLFREIWVPPEIRRRANQSVPSVPTPEQGYMMQRYQQLAAAGSFPWNATIAIEELDVQLDLGQSIGRPTLKVLGFWVSSQKSSDWEQNLCVQLQKIGAESAGRTSGVVDLQNLSVRTSIKWTSAENHRKHTPLVQASASFDFLRAKVGFDYQAFLVAEFSAIDFLMYNVRGIEVNVRDRLVSVLEGKRVQAFCTTSSAAQAIALVQAFQRLVEEKQKAYEASLADIERFLRRKSTIVPANVQEALSKQQTTDEGQPRSPLRLQTEVVVSIRAINLGCFPGVFTDTQVLKAEAVGTSARFAVYLEKDRIHSTLGMTLGQLRVALSNVNKTQKALGDVLIEDVITSATGSRGGTILKVPQLVATMQTWQDFGSTHIDYIFKSSFQGRVDVGWNYSRISYIRGMHANHVRKLAQRLGKPLPQSAVQITGLEAEGNGERSGDGGQEKITAVVNVPQSKYQYSALQPPVIETPQLRDMGEATPPLEWIGLHRERLPTLTHQIVIVTLLEVAKEVDDAYSKILGSSGGELLDH